jgi:ubiquinone/menaquinone biosynthesis C-methylase UbiE
MSNTEALHVSSDRWSDWLLHQRHGDDPDYESVVRDMIAEYRDRVLRGAKLASGMTLLDVGAGDGLIAFGALQQVSQPLSVILTDISAPLLLHAERISSDLGFRDCCSFIQSSAETLLGVADRSADALTSRAVFAYLQDKPLAAASFLRVLKPGGRVSLCEPIGQDAAVQLTALTNILRSQPVNVGTPYFALLQRCRALQMPSTLEGIQANPLTNFSERDLIQIFRTAGFVNIHMELHMDIKAGPAMPWSTFLKIAPRPGAPSLLDICEQHLSAPEIALLERGMKTDVENGTLVGQSATAYLTAEKPA